MDGRRGCKGVAGNGWGEEAADELGCADSYRREMGAENCAKGCGRRGCNGVAGNGWGEEAAGDERAWLRGRPRTGNEVRGRLRTAWVEMGREKKPLMMSELGCADGCGSKWVGRFGRTAADAVGAREWVEMGGEKKPLEISELGRADGCGREWVRRIARTAADSVGATAWLEMGGGEEAAGDVRA